MMPKTSESTMHPISSCEKTQRRVLRAALPSVSLVLLSVFWYHFIKNNLMTMGGESSSTSLTNSAIRCIYAMILTIGMEYVARYEHQYIWHSRALWFFHASHHHQSSKWGSGPSKDDAESNSFISPQKQNLELNDIFAAMFASVAMVAMYWAYDPHEPSYIHDVIFGSSCGISIYGTSYFIGHDLCAHERGGAKLAAFLRRISPTMAKCSHVHRVHHHKINVDARDEDDPYGPPYGFWLGPQEVEAYSAAAEHDNERELGMPLMLKASFWLGGVFLLYCCMVQ